MRTSHFLWGTYWKVFICSQILSIFPYMEICRCYPMLSYNMVHMKVMCTMSFKGHSFTQKAFLWQGLETRFLKVNYFSFVLWERLFRSHARDNAKDVSTLFKRIRLARLHWKTSGVEKCVVCERPLMVHFVLLELENLIYFYSTEKGDLNILQNIYFCVPHGQQCKGFKWILLKLPPKTLSISKSQMYSLNTLPWFSVAAVLCPSCENQCWSVCGNSRAPETVSSGCCSLRTTEDWEIFLP